MKPNQHLKAVLALAQDHTTPEQHQKLNHWLTADTENNCIKIGGAFPANYIRIHGPKKELQFGDTPKTWIKTSKEEFFAAIADQLPAVPEAEVA